MYGVLFTAGYAARGVIMPPIKSVRVFNSENNIYKGENIGPGLTVIIDPMPTDEADITQIGDDIRAAVLAFNRK